MTAREAIALLETCNPSTCYPWSKNPVLTHAEAVQVMLDTVRTHPDDYVLSNLMEKNVRKACRP